MPLRYQSTLLTCIRGCDDESKTWVGDKVAYSPGRRITSYLRWCIINPADLREVDEEEGAFFMSNPPDPWKPSAFGHLPLHWYTHVMHSLEIISYHHPINQVRKECRRMYLKVVSNLHLHLHLYPKTQEQMYERLTEDRMLKGTVLT
jgi:hypothetical protein